MQITSVNKGNVFHKVFFPCFYLLLFIFFVFLRSFHFVFLKNYGVSHSLRPCKILRGAADYKVVTVWATSHTVVLTCLFVRMYVSPSIPSVPTSQALFLFLFVFNQSFEIISLEAIYH